MKLKGRTVERVFGNIIETKVKQRLVEEEEQDRQELRMEISCLVFSIPLQEDKA